MIVLDASVVIELLLRTDLAESIEARIFAAGETLHAPQLIDLEVLQVLRRYCLHGELGTRRAQQAVDDFTALSLIRYPHELLLPRVWALRNSLSAYDAAYVVLAETLDATLLTTDQHMTKAHGHHARVVFVDSGNA